MESQGKIYKAISEVMKKMKAVARDRQMTEGGARYKFRGIDEMYNTLGPVMAEVGIFTAPTVLHAERKEVVSRNGSKGTHIALRVQYRFYADDGSFFDTVTEGEAIDYGDKAANKAQSIAHKYAITQTFIVRTEDQEQDDPDTSAPDAGVVKVPQVVTAAKQLKKVGAEPKELLDTVVRENGKPWSPSEAQLTRMWAIAGAAGWSKKDVKGFCEEHFGITSSKSLSRVQYETLCSTMEKVTDVKKHLAKQE